MNRDGAPRVFLLSARVERLSAQAAGVPGHEKTPDPAPMDEHLEHALTIATRCSFLRYKMGAVIVRGDEVLSTGWAHVPEARMMLWSMHAEHHALRRAHGDLAGSTCYVANIGRTGAIKLARPCADCTRLLMEAGVEKVVYTDPAAPIGLAWMSFHEMPKGTFKDYRSRRYGGLATSVQL